MKERELPSIERFEELGVPESADESAEDLARDTATKAVEACGLTGRKLVGDVRHGSNPIDVIV